MEQVVAVQARRTQLVYRGQAGCGAADLGDRDGAVERDYRSWRERVELVIAASGCLRGTRTSSQAPSREMAPRAGT